MRIEIVNPKGVARPLKPTYSNVIKVVNPTSIVFISGQVAFDENGNIVGLGDPEKQTRQALENLKKCVEAAGGSLDNIVKVTFYLTDVRYFDVVHKVRADYFKKNPPASTLVEVSKLAKPGLLVEVEAIAVL